MPILYLAIAFLLNASANVLLKLGAKNGLVLSGISIKTITDNALFIFGFICFALNALFYFLALRTLPLSVAYPVMVVMSLALISTFSLLYLREHLTNIQVLGYALLVAGVILIFFFNSSN